MRRSRESTLNSLTRSLEAATLLIEHNFSWQAMSLLAQVAEVAGSFYDKKPSAARAQSSKRFEAAMRHLPDKLYAIHAKRLYNQWRTHLVHSLEPGNYISLTNNKADHLLEAENVISIHLPTLLSHLNWLVQKLGSTKPELR